MIPIDVVRSSKDFVTGRLNAAQTLFETMPDDIQKTYMSCGNNQLTSVRDIFPKAVTDQDFVQLSAIMSVLHEKVQRIDDIGPSIVEDLIARLITDAETAAATDIYTVVATVFSRYNAEVEKNGRDTGANAMQTCLDLNRILDNINTRNYHTARKTMTSLLSRLVQTDDPDIRAWMIASLTRAGNALISMSPSPAIT